MTQQQEGNRLSLTTYVSYMHYVNNQMKTSFNFRTYITKTNLKGPLVSYFLSMLFNSCYVGAYQKMKLSISCFIYKVPLEYVNEP